jgi:hypothetical protein
VVSDVFKFFLHHFVYCIASISTMAQQGGLTTSLTAPSYTSTTTIDSGLASSIATTQMMTDEQRRRASASLMPTAATKMSVGSAGTGMDATTSVTSSSGMQTPLPKDLSNNSSTQRQSVHSTHALFVLAEVCVIIVLFLVFIYLFSFYSIWQMYLIQYVRVMIRIVCYHCWQMCGQMRCHI